MAVNRDKPDRWLADIAQSVDLYNQWFMKFAPAAFRTARVTATKDVEHALEVTANLTQVTTGAIKTNPEILPTLRMSTCPPIARDRLIGLANVTKSLVNTMEKERRLPARMPAATLNREIQKIGVIIDKLADPDIFVWRINRRRATAQEIARAATIVADRLCGAAADPIVRNAQEARQLKALGDWLSARGYARVPAGSGARFNELRAGTYALRLNVPVRQGDSGSVNIPVDAVIQPKASKAGALPLLVEAKSAGDYTNVNKRRKEEAKKVIQLRNTYGDRLQFVLLLCGYFDSDYLGYEAADRIDWVWEHRINDFTFLGL